MTKIDGIDRKGWWVSSPPVLPIFRLFFQLGNIFTPWMPVPGTPTELFVIFTLRTCGRSLCFFSFSRNSVRQGDRGVAHTPHRRGMESKCPHRQKRRQNSLLVLVSALGVEWMNEKWMAAHTRAAGGGIKNARPHHIEGSLLELFFSSSFFLFSFICGPKYCLWLLFRVRPQGRKLFVVGVSMIIIVCNSVGGRAWDAVVEAFLLFWADSSAKYLLGYNRWA